MFSYLKHQTVITGLWGQLINDFIPPFVKVSQVLSLVAYSRPGWQFGLCPEERTGWEPTDPDATKSLSTLCAQLGDLRPGPSSLSSVNPAADPLAPAPSLGSPKHLMRELVVNCKGDLWDLGMTRVGRKCSLTRGGGRPCPTVPQPPKVQPLRAMVSLRGLPTLALPKS